MASLSESAHDLACIGIFSHFFPVVRNYLLYISQTSQSVDSKVFLAETLSEKENEKKIRKKMNKHK